MLRSLSILAYYPMRGLNKGRNMMSVTLKGQSKQLLDFDD